MITDLMLRRFCMKQALDLGGGIIAGSILSYLSQWPEGIGSRHVVENIAEFWHTPEADVEAELNALVKRGAVKIIEGPVGAAYEYNRETLQWKQ